jgi:hypothetical protein
MAGAANSSEAEVRRIRARRTRRVEPAEGTSLLSAGAA